ncbi:MAG: TIGR04372 family glycosyltransferase, partial [Magnetospirillum sp.]
HGNRRVFSTLFLWTPERTVVDKKVAFAQLTRRWRADKLPPVLTLKDQHRREGEAILRRAGVPEGAWYVCLHMRSAAFNDQGLSNHNALRNVDIETYLPAVRRVVEEGGWVLRMGDPGMPPLPEMEHVVDYARSPLKSALMDVFLCATCRFFIASQSGLQYVAKNFGRPLVATNQLPEVLPDVDDDDIWLPRMLHSDRLGRPLSFREAFSPPYVNTEVRSALDRLGVRPLANTAEEIEAAVTEMLDRCAGRLAYDRADEELQRRFRQACDYHGYGQCGRVARRFLREHVDHL